MIKSANKNFHKKGKLDMNKIKAGWAETDITPENKVELYGQYYQRGSEGIHSRLGGSVLALESDKGEQAVMISVDLASFPREFLNELRGNLKDKLPDLKEIRIFPLFKKPKIIKVPKATGGHGGGDVRLLDMLFKEGIPDPLGHQAGSMGGELCPY